MGRIPKRSYVAFMIFTGCLTSFMLRALMSINMLAMVVPLDNLNTTVLDYGPRYHWSKVDQSTVLGAYFYGYLVTSLPAGFLAERFGPRAIVGLSLGFRVLFTAIVPLVAGFNVWVIIACRFMVGFMDGLPYPAFQNLISKWAPPDERGKFISMIAGGSTFGTVITWPIAGLLIENCGWIWAFYIPSIFVLLVTILWYALIQNTPSEHSAISDEEKDYITKSLGHGTVKKSNWPPLLSVFTSLPFYALLLLHYGNHWGMQFLITMAPKFMSEILKFNLANAGFLSGLPYLARMISGFAFGILGDYIRRRQSMSVTMTRKFFCLFSHFLPGVFLIGVPYISTNPYVCVAIMIISLGFNGASTITNLQNVQDIAPSYVASIYGIMNFVGTSSGFFSPLLVHAFTREHNTMNEWQYVFIISSLIYIISGLVFLVFGTGKVQKWNSPPEKKTEDIEIKAVTG